MKKDLRKPFDSGGFARRLDPRWSQGAAQAALTQEELSAGENFPVGSSGTYRIGGLDP